MMDLVRQRLSLRPVTCITTLLALAFTVLIVAGAEPAAAQTYGATPTRPAATVARPAATVARPAATVARPAATAARPVAPIAPAAMPRAGGGGMATSFVDESAAPNRSIGFGLVGLAGIGGLGLLYARRLRRA